MPSRSASRTKAGSRAISWGSLLHILALRRAACLGVGIEVSNARHLNELFLRCLKHVVALACAASGFGAGSFGSRFVRALSAFSGVRGARGFRLREAALNRALKFGACV
jgi:hypothetical protein